MQRRYSFIFSKLVLSSNDFAGQIAYSLYKQDKINFIRDFIKEKGGGEPVEDDFISFHKFSSTESAIQSYRLKAEMVLQEFLVNSLDEAIKAATAEIKSNQEILLKKVIAPIKPVGFWMGVWQNAVATFMFSALLALVILIISVSTEGFWDTMGKLFNKEIKSKTEQVMQRPTILKP